MLLAGAISTSGWFVAVEDGLLLGVMKGVDAPFVLVSLSKLTFL